MGNYCKLFTLSFNGLVILTFIVIIYYHISYTQNTETPDSRCKTISDCLGKNQMCFNNECKCGPNDRWNQSIQKCERFVCSRDSDCNALDRNLICKLDYVYYHNSCLCDYGYVMNPKLNFCHKILTEREESIVKLRNKFLLKNPNKISCISSQDCPSNQFCCNNSCECKPNYVFEKQTNRCVYKSCNSDTDCNVFDDKRVCFRNSCDKCRKYYYIESESRFCRPTIDMECTNSSDCSLLGDTHQICVDNHCVCKPNHRLNTSLAQCMPYSCLSDADCQLQDRFRVCRKSYCKCLTNYRPDVYNQKCEFDSFNLWYLWILWWLLVMPFILIAIVLFKRCTKANINASNASLNSRTPIVYYKNNYRNYS